MVCYRGVRFLISPQVDGQTSETVKRLLVDEGAIATDEAIGLDDCDLYVTHLSPGQLAAGTMPTPAHSRGLRMLLSLDSNNHLNFQPQPPASAEDGAHGAAERRGGGGSGAMSAPAAVPARSLAGGGVRSGLISTPQQSGGSDLLLRRALRLSSVECVASRSLLARLGARAYAPGAALPGAAPAPRGSAPSDSMLPRSVKLSSALAISIRDGLATAAAAAAPLSRPAARAPKPGEAGAPVPGEAGAPVPDGAGAPPPPEPPAAAPLCRMHSIARTESLCTEASLPTASTALSATATAAQLQAAVCGARGKAREAHAAAAAVPSGSHHLAAAEARNAPAAPPQPRRPSGALFAAPQPLPAGAWLVSAQGRAAAASHTMLIVPPRAGVSGAPTTIRRPLEPTAGPRIANNAAQALPGCTAQPPPDCAQLTVCDLAGRYKPLRGTIDAYRLRRMWPRRVTAAQKAAAASQDGGCAPRAGSKRPLAPDAGAQQRGAAAKVAALPAKLSRCDVCDARYADLDEHLASQRHREVVEHPDYFKELDAFIELHGLGVG